MSHSKRNTSLAFFTSHERSLLKSHWGSQSTRLTRDSFLPFASCNLCLQPAIAPVACATNGELFCRECIVSNLLSQRKEIKRVEKEALSRREWEEEEERARGREEGERAVLEFEKTMIGLETPVAGYGIDQKKKKMTKEKEKEKASMNTHGGVPVEEQNYNQANDQQGGNPENKTLKRKFFSLDEASMLQNAQHERAKARRAIEDESAARDSLPSFWVPALTPSTGNDTHKLTPSNSTTTATATAQLPKLHTLCPGSSPESKHPLSLKTLIDVQFKSAPNAEGNEVPQGAAGKENNNISTKYICPACSKHLSNALKAVMALPCGHVLCKPCAGKFMMMSGDDANDATDPLDGDQMGVKGKGGESRCCYVCESNLVPAEGGKKEKTKGDKGAVAGVRPGVVELRCEGTGFAGGGGNMVKAKGTAFQC